MVVTFDFDDTLTRNRLDDDYGIRYMGLNSETIDKLKQHFRDGDVVHVVTSRREYLKEQGLHNYIESVVFTDGNLKSGVLKHLGADIHYDDDTEELKALHPDTKGVLIDYETGEVIEEI